VYDTRSLTNPSRSRDWRVAVKQPSLSWTRMATDVDATSSISTGGISDTSTNELVHHFMHNYAAMYGVPLDPRAWALACRYPCLFSSIVAVSACHLRYHATDPTPYRVAEHAHQSIALRSFQEFLGQPLDQARADALLMTAMMLNTLSFAFVADSSPSKSWVLSNEQDRLGWLGLQMGLKSLLLATRPFRDGSILWPIFLASEDESKTFSSDGSSLAHVPPAWIQLISTSEGNSSRENIVACFREPVRVLAVIRNLEPSEMNLYRYLQFVGKLEPEFRQLLFERDERALWIFGYWLGVMGRMTLWWCSPRVRTDLAAIKSFLIRNVVCDRGRGDSEMWCLLMMELDTVQCVHEVGTYD
jgi:hypothetical protein